MGSEENRNSIIELQNINKSLNKEIKDIKLDVGRRGEVVAKLLKIHEEVLEEVIERCYNYMGAKNFGSKGELLKKLKSSKLKNSNKSVPKSEEAICMTDKEFMDDITSTELKEEDIDFDILRNEKE